jgi:dephospho-CoA kinase
MMLVGLTGSLAMGKSQTARMFAELGCPVFDADLEVHRLYAAGGGAVAPVAALFPAALVDGAIDRDRLSALLLADPAALSSLEAIVHPLVGEAEARFIAAAEAAQQLAADIPLFVAVGRDSAMDRPCASALPRSSVGAPRPTRLPEEARPAAGAPDLRCRQAGAISLWIPAAASTMHLTGCGGSCPIA